MNGRPPLKTRPVQALERALALLEQLAAADDGLALNELCMRTSLKAPTVHNLLRTLASRGYVVKAGSPVRYAVGPALQTLARRATRDRLQQAAERELRTLAAAFPEARLSWVTFATGEPVMRLRIAPGTPDAVERPHSAPLSPYASASAIALQAFGDPETVAEFRRRHPFWEQGATLWQTPEKLDAALKGFRAAACVTLKLRGEDLCKLAAPIFADAGTFVAVLGAALPDTAKEAERNKLLRQLRTAAQRLTHSTLNREP